MSAPKPRPARITGAKHFFAAATYSAAGIQRLWAETAFRHEVFGLVAVAAFLVIWGASLAEFLIFAVLFALLIMAEALNTAIEEVVDHVSPHWSESARNAKDLGSLAVLCVLISHGLFLAYVVFA